MKKNCICSTDQSDYKNHSYSFIFILMFKCGEKEKLLKWKIKAEKKRGGLKTKIETAFSCYLNMSGFKRGICNLSRFKWFVLKKYGKKAPKEFFMPLSFLDCVPEPAILLLFDATSFIFSDQWPDIYFIKYMVYDSCCMVRLYQFIK